MVSRLIATAARERLKPLGLHQRGRSRIWYDDRDWSLITVEFQPPRTLGTYLNVGATWLWTDRDHLSFDEGNRLHWRSDGSFTSTAPLGEPGWRQLLEYRDADQFSRDIQLVVDVAARRVVELRAMLPDPCGAAELLAGRQTRPDESPWWHAYHSGAAAGLCGDVASARRGFDRIAVGDLDPGWAHDLARQAAELSGLGNDVDALRRRLVDTIQTTRQRLKLSP
jgi:hypothetical protein